MTKYGYLNIKSRTAYIVFDSDKWLVHYKYIVSFASELRLMDWLSQYDVDIYPCSDTKFLLKVDTNNFQRLSNDLTVLENDPFILKDDDNV